MAIERIKLIKARKPDHCGSWPSFGCQAVIQKGEMHYRSTLCFGRQSSDFPMTRKICVACWDKGVRLGAKYGGKNTKVVMEEPSARHERAA